MWTEIKIEPELSEFKLELSNQAGVEYKNQTQASSFFKLR